MLCLFKHKWVSGKEFDFASRAPQITFTIPYRTSGVDLHFRARQCPLSAIHAIGREMVGGTGFEPVIPAV